MVVIAFYHITAAYATRKKLVRPLFGASEELPNNVLPTYLNVMKYYNEIKRCLAFTKQNYNPCFTEIAENVTNEIKKLWVRYLLTDLKKIVDQVIRRNNSFLPTQRISSSL